MDSPITIYECPNGHEPRSFATIYKTVCGQCGAEFVETRMFREEDVRPLVEALRAVASTEPLHEDEAGRDSPMDEAIDACHDIARAAIDTFPAPEEWKA